MRSSVRLVQTCLGAVNTSSSFCLEGVGWGNTYKILIRVYHGMGHCINSELKQKVSPNSAIKVGLI